MIKNILLLIALATVLGAHAVAIDAALYNRYWWFDAILHAAGGMWVAAFSISVLRIRSLIGIGFFVFAIGVAWEILEFIFNVPFFGVGEASSSDPLWVLDTLTDLIIDVFAGILFSLLAFRKSRYTGTNA